MLYSPGQTCLPQLPKTPTQVKDPASLPHDFHGLESALKNLLEDYRQDQGLALAWRACVIFNMSLSFSTSQLCHLKHRHKYIRLQPAPWL